MVWQLWYRLSLASHTVSNKGDHEISLWAMAAFLAGVAVAMSVLAWAVLRKPNADRACTSAGVSSSAPAVAGECASTSA